MKFEEKKVLIVDDIPENIQVLSNILYDAGMEIGIAMDGEQAIDTVKENPPNLILLDVNMPKMNGFEVCKHLKSKEETKDIPIIFLTAKTETEDIVQGLKLGAVDYITKPFNADELLTRVYTHLELHNSRLIIKKQMEKLESLNKTKDRFFSIIAHDLKSPINGLVGLSDMLVDDFDNLDAEQIKSIHHVMQESSKKGLKLLKNLLDWSRVQVGQVKFEPAKNNLKKLVDDCFALLSGSAQLKNITFENEIDEKLEANFDYNMINTVVRNLINNAIKFTNNGGAIKACAGRIGDELEICIIDNGVGMKEDVRTQLFRIDKQVTTKGTNNEIGTGLGLIICMEYIKLHRGEIGVESKVGEGSKFYFRIPIK